MIKDSYLIFSNAGEVNDVAAQKIHKKMREYGWTEVFHREEASLIYCIGGDGALLRLIRRSKFPKAAIVGINTGHLGFFQEIPVEELDSFFEKFEAKDYRIQDYIGISVDIYGSEGLIRNCVAINEVVIKGKGERLMHMGMSIGGQDVTRFSGDGVLICTPAGSTAYNYSLGGAIVDPDVDMLQITPMAPVNNSAYRSLSSSIIMPTRTSIEIIPEIIREGGVPNEVVVVEDGGTVAEGFITKVVVRVAEDKAHIMRFSGYNFWDKVRDKIIG